MRALDAIQKTVSMLVGIAVGWRTPSQVSCGECERQMACDLPPDGPCRNAIPIKSDLRRSPVYSIFESSMLAPLPSRWNPPSTSRK